MTLGARVGLAAAGAKLPPPLPPPPPPPPPLLLLLLLLALARTAEATTSSSLCQGASSKLAPDQCAAWGQLFDATGGPHWTGKGAGCSRVDPCGCGENVCSADGTSLTEM